MKDTNIVILTGRLGKDAEGRYTTAGKFVASFSIANNQGYTSNGEQVEETVWTDISVWGKLVEFANEKLKSGMLVLVGARGHGTMAPMRPLLCLSLVLPLAAAGPDASADARRLRPDHAPTPFTAEEIRKACAEGRTDTFSLERGKEKWSHTIRFLKGDAETVEVEYTNTAEDGKTLKTWKDRQGWIDFQTHASFPEIDTKINEETIEVPAGKFECWLYTVQKREGDAATIRMYFAKKLPGPPVKMTSEEVGKTVFTMVLLEHEDGGKKEEEKAPEKGKEPGKG